MASEDAVTAPLLMDRSIPLGNSVDVFTRRALHTKIGNSSSEPIPVYLSTPAASSSPTNTFDSVTNVASGSETTIVTYTVLAGTQIALDQVQFSGGNIALYSVYVDADKIATFRTYFGGELSGALTFSGLVVDPGSVLTLKVIHDRPYPADFEGRILGVVSNV